MPDIVGLFIFWGWIAAAAFSIMTALVALVYALGSLLMNEKMKTWAKMELLEIFYSALVFSLCISSVGIVDAIVQGALGVSNLGGGQSTQTWIRDPEAGFPDETLIDICGPRMARSGIYGDLESCHIRLATYYLREIFAEGRDFAYAVYRSYLWTSIAAEFSINIEFVFEQAGFFTWNPFRGFYTMGNLIKDLAFDWAMKINLLTKFQELMLRFVAVALFPALLILGCILRTFVFTRKLGGLLLGIAIALYFIYPAFYAFGGLVLIDLKEKARPMWENDPANPGNRYLGTPISHNPPLANTLYVDGTINMVGGDVSNQELEERLRAYEDMSDEEFKQCVEEGRCGSAGGGLAPNIDLSKNFGSMSDNEKERAFNRMQEASQSWRESVFRMNLIDRLAQSIPGGPSYWGPGGFIDVLARLTFFSLFFSLFGLLGTIAAIRSLSITFGGDIEIAGLTRLI